MGGLMNATARHTGAGRRRDSSWAGPYPYPQVRDAIEGNPNGIVSSSPGLRACEPPWDIVQTASQSQRGCGCARHPRTQPRWGRFVLTRWTQGTSPALSDNPSPLIQPKCSQCATVVLIPLPRKSGVATLGFVAESLRDSHDSSPEMWVRMSPQERVNRARVLWSLVPYGGNP